MGLPTTKGSGICPNCNKTGAPVNAPRDSITVENVVTSPHASWSLWTTHNGHKLPMPSGTRNCPPCPHAIHHQRKKYCSDAGPFWRWRLSDPKHVTLCTQLTIMPWIMKAALCKLGMPPRLRCYQIEPNLGSSGAFHLQEWGASPFLSSLPDAMELEEVISL